MLNLLGVTEFKIANFLGDDCAFMFWFEGGNKLGLEAASLLGIEVTHLLGYIQEGGDFLVMALLSTFLCDAPCTANFDRELLATGITNKLAGLLLNVLGGTRGLIHSPAFFRALTIADFLQRPVALFHSFG